MQEQMLFFCFHLLPPNMGYKAFLVINDKIKWQMFSKTLKLQLFLLKMLDFVPI